MANPALTNDSTPALDWADVSGANLYHCQVSLYADFRTIEAENNALATSTYTPGSALGTDDSKYYWRWRYSTDSGSTWSVWSEKYSFWYNSAFTGTQSPTTWMLVAPTPVALTDAYSFSVYPEHLEVEQQILRAQRRNLAGDMIVEAVGVAKAKVTLVHEGAFIASAQRNEILRFYNMATGFFLLAAIHNGTEKVEKVWKVIISEPPEFNVLSPGREDFFTTTLQFEEV